jgi:hypothetical protein
MNSDIYNLIIIKSICLFIYYIVLIKHSLDKIEEYIQKIKKIKIVLSMDDFENQERKYNGILCVQKTSKLPKDIIRYVISYV